MVWQVHLLDEEVLEAAVTVQKLQRSRASLKALHHKLQVHFPCLQHTKRQSS